MLYLGPYQWRSSADFVAWMPPVGANPVVDLRGLPMQAAAGGRPNGFGIFAGPAGLDAAYLPLGGTADDLLTTSSRRAWETRLGFTSLMNARSIIEAIWETLTLRADPQGQNNAKPLIPEARTRQLVLHCDRTARRVRFSPTMPEFNGIQAVLRNDYRRIRQAVLNGDIPANHHRKILGFWQRKYGIQDERVFIPADLPKETAIAPTTTITDNFNRADANPINAGSEGWTWTAKAGASWKVISNQMQAASGTNAIFYWCRADSDLSSSDHYAEHTIESRGNFTTEDGPMCRKDSTTAETYYTAHYDADSPATSDNWITYKFVAGTLTALSSENGPELTLGDILKLECNGSTIERFLNGVSKSSITDTAITGNLRTGTSIRSSGSSGSLMDNFKAADLATGQIVVVGLASETDTAFGVTIARTLNPGLAAEADTAFAAVAAKTLALGQTLETDTAPAATAAKALAVGQTLETDTAFAVTIVRALLAGLALETDTAFAVGMARALALGLALETDTAFAVTIVRALLAGLALEADSAFAVGAAKALAVGLALETDTAFALVMANVILVPVIPLAGSTQGAIALVGTSGTIALLGLSRAAIDLKGSP